MPLPNYTLDQTIVRTRLNPVVTRNEYQEIIDDFDTVPAKTFKASVDQNHQKVSFSGPGGVVTSDYVAFVQYWQYEESNSGGLVRVVSDIKVLDRITWNGDNYRVVFINDTNNTHDNLEVGINIETGGN